MQDHNRNIDPLDLPPVPAPRAPPPDTGVVGEGLKWIYGAIALAAAVASLAGLRAKQLGISPEDADTLHLFSFWLLPAAAVLVNVLWLFAAWGELPPERRGGISTVMVGLLLAVPVWGLAWLHEVHQKLCAGIAYSLTELGKSRPVPTGLATLATLLFIALFGAYLLYPERTFLPFVANSAAWFMYMFELDAARGDLKEALLARDWR